MLTEADLSRQDLPHGLDYYQRLRARIDNWLKSRGGRSHRYTEYVLLAPDLFHLLIKLSFDPRVPRRDRLLLLGAAGYFVTALDLIPELFLGPGGFVDDISLAAYVIHSVVRGAGEETVREYWAGEGDVLEALERVLRFATDLVGTGVWGRLKGAFQRGGT
jgi:uncharacterized membrane protein YkvA (DUF1232 family)